MTEVIFILVTVYVVYVIHRTVTSNQRKKAEAHKSKPKASVTQTASKKEEKKAVIEKKPVAKKASPEKPTEKVASGSLRNPETGEVDKIANSYRMCKRWIKEALVAEGLVEKIYKTNEIDDAAKVKINKALTKLAKMDKYQ